MVYETTADYDRAGKCYLQALDIRLRVLGQEHQDYAGNKERLARLYEKTGDPVKAAQFRGKTGEVFSSTPRPAEGEEPR